MAVVEMPLSSVALVATFCVAALFLTTKYVVATWTTSVIIVLLTVFALQKFRVMPHVTLLVPILVVALLAAIAADIGFRFFDGDDEIPGATIVATLALFLIIYGYSKGWF